MSEWLPQWMLEHCTPEIHDSLEAEERLAQAHEDMAQLLASLPSALIGLSADDRVIRWNRAAEETFGLSAVEVRARSFRDCPIQWNWDRIASALAVCRREGAPTRLDNFRLLGPAGNERFLNLVISPVQSGPGGSPGVILLGSDITEYKFLESQLIQAQKLESIGQLAAGIAHEINTPTQYVGDNVRFLQDAFNDLLGLIEKYRKLQEAAKGGTVPEALLREVEEGAEEADLEYLEQEIPQAIEQSLEGIGRVSMIVHAMREFSHPGRDEKTAMDINQAIESTITVSRNVWKYVAEMVTDLDPGLPLVPCLPGELNQVVLNMITNAAHAIADVVGGQGKEKGTITVSTGTRGEYAEIRIGDTGGGIPPEVRSRIFDPFFTTKEVGKGTGQGLAISHAVIVEKHGGTVTFETEVGKGTTFIIRIPLEDPQGRETEWG